MALCQEQQTYQSMLYESRAGNCRRSAWPVADYLRNTNIDIIMAAKQDTAICTVHATPFPARCVLAVKYCKV